MPHTKSAWKRLRQTEKRRARNRAAKKAIKVQIKKFLVVLKDGTPEEKKTEFLQAIKKLDKAGVRRVLHPNTVARRKSALERKLREPTPATAPAASA